MTIPDQPSWYHLSRALIQCSNRLETHRLSTISLSFHRCKVSTYRFTIRDLHIEVEEEAGSDSGMAKCWSRSVYPMRCKDLNFLKELRTLGPSFV
jgi:hypothetical protein